MEYELLALVAAIVVLSYAVFPLVMLGMMRLAVKPQAEAFDCGQIISEQLSGGLAEAAAALDADGFERVAIIHVAQAVRFTGSTEALVILWINRGACDLAMISSVFCGHASVHYVEFVTQFRDGRVIETNNSSNLSPFAPKPPHHHLGKFPQVRDVRLLYRLHQAQCQRHAPASLKIMRLDTDFDGDAAAYVVGSVAEDFARQVDAGYLWLPLGAAEYRLTIRGALLMAWKSLFPIKQLRQAACRRTARRLLSELENAAVC